MIGHFARMRDNIAFRAPVSQVGGGRGGGEGGTKKEEEKEGGKKRFCKKCNSEK